MAKRTPARNKTVANANSVTEFLAAVENPARRQDCRRVMDIMGEETGEPPVMWGTSIIGFGAYHYVYASGREGDMPLVGVSPRKQSLVLYIMSGFDGKADLLARLGRHRIGKSCLYISKLDAVHLPTLRELVQGSVKEMRQQHGAS